MARRLEKYPESFLVNTIQQYRICNHHGDIPCVFQTSPNSLGKYHHGRWKNIRICLGDGFSMANVTKICLKFDANRKSEPKHILSNCGLASWWWIPWNGIRKKWPKKTIQGYLQPPGKLTAISRRQKWWELENNKPFLVKHAHFLEDTQTYIGTQHTHIQKDDTFINTQNPWIFGYPTFSLNKTTTGFGIHSSKFFGGRIWSRSPSSLLTDPRNHEQMICNLDTLQSHVKHPKASKMVRCSTIGLIVIHDISGQLIINPQPELFRPFWVLFPYYLLGWAPRVGRYKLPSKSSQKNWLVIFLVQIMYTGCIHSVNTSIYIYLHGWIAIWLVLNHLHLVAMLCSG